METKCDDGTLRILDDGICEARKAACARHVPFLRNTSGAGLVLSPAAAHNMFVLPKAVSCDLRSKQ